MNNGTYAQWGDVTGGLFNTPIEVGPGSNSGARQAAEQGAWR